jgi:large subunit ribosomal protein L31
MKADIHPKYNKTSTTTCVCGATFNFGTTLADMKIEICSNCHPFYTGLDKTLDGAGRVDRFKKRMAKVVA